MIQRGRHRKLLGPYCSYYIAIRHAKRACGLWPDTPKQPVVLACVHDIRRYFQSKSGGCIWYL